MTELAKRYLDSARRQFPDYQSDVVEGQFGAQEVLRLCNGNKAWSLTIRGLETVGASYGKHFDNDGNEVEGPMAPYTQRVLQAPYDAADSIVRAMGEKIR